MPTIWKQYFKVSIQFLIMTPNICILVNNIYVTTLPPSRRCLFFLILGNSNIVYTIIRKRNVFHQLANLPIDHSSIARALNKRGRRGTSQQNTEDTDNAPSMEGSVPATEAEPGTLKVSLAATPGRFDLIVIYFIVSPRFLCIGFRF